MMPRPSPIATAVPMKLQILLASLFALPLAAQNDVVYLQDGSKLDTGKVASFDVRKLKYGDKEFPTDQVVKVELAQFRDTFRIGLKDPGLLQTKAKEALKDGKVLLGQLGLLQAASLYLDSNQAGEAMGALDELQKTVPEAGVMPDVYRMKFEYYMGLGQKGVVSAVTVAKKYQSDVGGAAWAPGLAAEAEFFVAMAERAAGGAPKDFQQKLRSVIGKALGGNPMVANRANVQLANSLRENKDLEGARKIYDDLAKKDKVDASARAGALLGLGYLAMEEGSPNNKEPFRKALLLFLRVRLETRDAWPSLHAEALYQAIVAADKWRGNDFQYIMSRCRSVLLGEFGESEWAARAKAGR